MTVRKIGVEMEMTAKVAITYRRFKDNSKVFKWRRGEMKEKLVEIRCKWQQSRKSSTVDDATPAVVCRYDIKLSSF